MLDTTIYVHTRRNIQRAMSSDLASQNENVSLAPKSSLYSSPSVPEDDAVFICGDDLSSSRISENPRGCSLDKAVPCRGLRKTCRPAKRRAQSAHAGSLCFETCSPRLLHIACSFLLGSVIFHAPLSSPGPTCPVIPCSEGEEGSLEQ